MVPIYESGLYDEIHEFHALELRIEVRVNFKAGLNRDSNANKFDATAK